ncbi:ATP-binding protein [Kaistia geumhonensis]|uniref:histidine kinase n=1 Tax=Kaistia geumhonensis TaxID=410839 RepID=A0ABU0M9I3_9HYPH|nr:ATP-binding protein [Kaistia geumhonensis]MCX5480671.1 ATP-binding protein [Kaistia geumhonensis]MDQ0517625.1 signal transduction histidine kinase [Kaistia geumhonensis]
MRASLPRLWPRSLAGRLVIMLVAALALAQLGLTLILRVQQDALLDGVIHGQALNQTVALARLLTDYPASDGERIARAFGSRGSCASVAAAPPPAHPPGPAERDLAQLLQQMLHGVEAAPPIVSVEPLGPDRHPCPTGRPGPPPPDHRPPAPEGDRPGGPRRVAAVAMTVPLADGRFATLRSAVELPGGFGRVALLSFLLSALAVAAVAVLAIRGQTRSLRHLADASERFGRGEAVPHLAETGPSEVVAATRAFNTMQQRLGDFMSDRLRLLASISHDLRTPLTTLRLKAEFIEDEAVRDDIVATIDELTVICEATLAFTRAEATSEATALLRLDQLVADCIEEFRLAGADVEAADLAAVTYPCRPVALKRALRNLVENAVRYGHEARVSVRDEADAVAVAVADAGPGLPEDRMDEAFQPFVRLEPSRSTETGGIGLGLAIARSIVQAHGGTLMLENRPQGGLVATIRLPKAAAS